MTVSAPSVPTRDPRRYDVVVIGAGVAGLAFTLRLPPALRVALLTKAALGESNTRYAQGGLAAAVGADDSPDLHYEDTLVAGAGLCDPAAVRDLVDGAPEAVRWLIGIGTGFDRDDHGYALGREGAHSRRRVLHAGGDATGAEIECAMVARVQADPRIDVFEHAFAHDLLLDGDRTVGIVADIGAGPERLLAPVTVIAAGGAGQLWATTSNPEGATADGLAMAIRAGAAIADVEFMQFHPTVLAAPGVAPFLVSEAVRGEGAWLRDAAGERFMAALDPRAELAPRDVVARAIQRQLTLDGRDHVDLDLRHLDAAETLARFPTIAAELAARGLDLARDLIPIAPAAHYFMGGIVAATDGTTSLPGLLALGEAACTGVHGANRLASNSLLEGLVFGLRAADRLASQPSTTPPAIGIDPAAASDDFADLPDAAAVAALRGELQRTMSRDVSVVRDRAGLADAAGMIASLRQTIGRWRPSSRRDIRELANLADAATAVVAAATHREESRGAHARADFPATDPALDGHHSLSGGDSGPAWRFGPLAPVPPEPVSSSTTE